MKLILELFRFTLEPFEAHPGFMVAHSEAMKEPHPGTVRFTLELWRFTLEVRRLILEAKRGEDTHPGVMEAHPGVMEAHPGVLEINLESKGSS
jgi:hypothetical protein